MTLPVTVNGKFPKLAAFVVVTLAFLGIEIPGAAVQAQPSQSTPVSEQASGTYLYGESPQLNQMSQIYLVFQRQNGKVVGAIYSPNSEFDCFTGFQNDKTLSVKSISTGESQLSTTKINLLELHPIKTVSANEQRILSTCKQAAELQEKR